MNKKQKHLKKRNQIFNHKLKTYSKRKQFKKVTQLMKELSVFCRHHKVAAITKNQNIYMISHETSDAGIQKILGTPISMDFSGSETKIIIHK